MRVVYLLTRDGRPMLDLMTNSPGYVACVSVLPMTPPPEALLWGSRCFLFSEEHDGFDVYKEGFLYVVPSLTGALPAPEGVGA